MKDGVLMIIHIYAKVSSYFINRHIRHDDICWHCIYVNKEEVMEALFLFSGLAIVGTVAFIAIFWYQRTHT